MFFQYPYYIFDFYFIKTEIRMKAETIEKVEKMISSRRFVMPTDLADKPFPMLLEGIRYIVDPIEFDKTGIKSLQKDIVSIEPVKKQDQADSPDFPKQIIDNMTPGCVWYFHKEKNKDIQKHISRHDERIYKTRPSTTRNSVGAGYVEITRIK